MWNPEGVICRLQVIIRGQSFTVCADRKYLWSQEIVFIVNLYPGPDRSKFHSFTFLKPKKVVVGLHDLLPHGKMLLLLIKYSNYLCLVNYARKGSILTELMYFSRLYIYVTLRGNWTQIDLLWFLLISSLMQQRFLRPPLKRKAFYYG